MPVSDHRQWASRLYLFSLLQRVRRYLPSQLHQLVWLHLIRVEYSCYFVCIYTSGSATADLWFQRIDKMRMVGNRSRAVVIVYYNTCLM